MGLGAAQWRLLRRLGGPQWRRWGRGKKNVRSYRKQSPSFSLWASQYTDWAASRLTISSSFWRSFFLANSKFLRLDLASWVMKRCGLAGAYHSPEGTCCLCSQDTCKQAAFCFSHDGCNNFFLKPVPTYQTTRCRDPKVLPQNSKRVSLTI